MSKVLFKTKKILLAVDGSKVSDRAVLAAAELAKIINAKVIIVHAINKLSVTYYTSALEEPEEEIVEKLKKSGKFYLNAAEKEMKIHGINSEKILEVGFPVDVIIEQAKKNDVDLIVMGSRGMTKGRGLVGSTAEHVVRRSECPVLVVK